MGIIEGSEQENKWSTLLMEQYEAWERQIEGWVFNQEATVKIQARENQEWVYGPEDGIERTWSQF